MSNRCVSLSRSASYLIVLAFMMVGCKSTSKVASAGSAIKQTSDKATLKSWDGCFDEVHSLGNVVDHICIKVEGENKFHVSSDLKSGDSNKQDFILGQTEVTGDSVLQLLWRSPQAAALVAAQGVAGTRVKVFSGMQEGNLFIRKDVYHINFVGGVRLYLSTLELFRDDEDKQSFAFDQTTYSESGKVISKDSFTHVLRKAEGK